MPGNANSWRKQAACRGLDPNVFIPQKKDSKDTIHYDKTICDGCQVKQPCLEYALANRAKLGLWGGTTPKQREKLYALYEGERTYELNLDRILFPRSNDNDTISRKDSVASDSGSDVCDSMADNTSIRVSWVTENFIQGTLF